MVSSVSRYWAGVYCICFCVGLPLAGSVGAQIIFTETTESFHARSTAFGDYDNDGCVSL